MTAPHKIPSHYCHTQYYLNGTRNPIDQGHNHWHSKYMSGSMFVYSIIYGSITDIDLMHSLLMSKYYLKLEHVHSMTITI